MARQIPVGRRSRMSRARHAGRRAWPLVMMAWERWQALPEAEKERYRQMARDAAERGRSAVKRARSRRRGPTIPRP